MAFCLFDVKIGCRKNTCKVQGFWSVLHVRTELPICLWEQHCSCLRRKLMFWCNGKDLR